MLQTIEVKTYRSMLKKYPYQLTEWMPEMNKSYTDPFKQYKKEHKAVILHSPQGFAIFTTGELLTDFHKKNEN